MTFEQTRRDFVSFALKLPVAGWLFQGASSLLYGSSQEPKAPKKDEHFDVVVIGSGFGGSLSALTLARQFQESAEHRYVGGRRLMITPLYPRR